MHKFFISNDFIDGEVVKITGSDFNHISHSLRLKIGDNIIITSEDGFDYLVKIDDFKEKMVLGKILRREENKNEPILKVSLAQAIPKKNNMDFIVQKCTEIGINAILPLITDRTIVRLESKKKAKKIERWQRIALEAAKQSQRGIVPQISEIYFLRDLQKCISDYDLVLLLWEKEKNNHLKNILKNNKNKYKNVLIIVGPEGGFSADEVKYLLEMKAIPLTLGSRILRTETAGIVGLTMLLYESGDLGGN